MNASTLIELVRSSVSLVLTAGAGLAGVVIGARLSSLREREARRYAFIEKQVTELYSPLVGIRREIRAKSELRQKLAQLSNEVWQEMIAGKPSDQVEKLNQSRLPEFLGHIRYDNLQLTEELPARI